MSLKRNKLLLKVPLAKFGKAKFFYEDRTHSST
jgi:hypothetical protein